MDLLLDDFFGWIRFFPSSGKIRCHLVIWCMLRKPTPNLVGLATLPTSNSLPLEIGRAPKGNEKVFQPSIFIIFRCENVRNSGRVSSLPRFSYYFSLPRFHMSLVEFFHGFLGLLFMSHKSIDMWLVLVCLAMNFRIYSYN